MFLDTSGLMCLLDKRDHRHAEATSLYRTARVRLTSSYVLAEYVALAHVRSLSRQQTLDFSAEVLDDKNVEIVWVDELLHRSAVNLLQARRDKTYSLCDAVSFVLMRERGIREALTTDKHFEQEGFIRLLTPQKRVGQVLNLSALLIPRVPDRLRTCPTLFIVSGRRSRHERLLRKG